MKSAMQGSETKLPAVRCPMCRRDMTGRDLTCNICESNGVTIYFDSGTCWAKHQEEQHAARVTRERR
jgi:hypothetical protein